MSTLIIRFSSLGDIVLTAAVTASVDEVIYVTHRRYADLAERLPGVREVIALEVGESVNSLAARIPPVDRVIDLHGSLRSRALCLRLGRPTHRVRGVQLARRSHVALKWPRQLQPVVERYCEAAGVHVPDTPWIALPTQSGSRSLGIVPLAAHATKRWPVEKWAALAGSWEGPVVAFGGPEDAAVLHQVQEESGREITALAERGFTQTFEAMGRLQVLVGGDTGLMHLAAVCGVPVVGIYGATTSKDGFWCHPGIVVESSLGCRPCSRHGSDLCPVGDHACMEGVAVAEVSAAIEMLLNRPAEEILVDFGSRIHRVPDDEGETAT